MLEKYVDAHDLISGFIPFCAEPMSLEPWMPLALVSTHRSFCRPPTPAKFIRRQDTGKRFGSSPSGTALDAWCSALWLSVTPSESPNLVHSMASSFWPKSETDLRYVHRYYVSLNGSDKPVG